MKDATALPYIDLGQPADILRQYAKDNFGKVISPIAKDETVIDRFQSIYEEETGIKLQPVAKVDIDENEDDALVPEKATPKAKTKAEKPKPIAATIIIQDDPTDPMPITGGANFLSYRIKRNEEVRVSMAIINSLSDAKKTLYDPKTMASKEVLLYPFSIIKYHFEGDDE